MDLDELPQPQEEKSSSSTAVRNAMILYTCTVIMVLTRSIDFVLYIRMATKMRNYEYILADILLSLGFMCIAWPVVWYKMFVSKTIDKKMRSFPNYKFILMGVFDSLSVLISTIPAAYVSGSVNVVMSQSVVIVNMAASFFFLHLRYNLFHIGGVALVMAGIIVDIWPMFAADSSSGGGDSMTWLWILLLFAANIPMAASNVYKEKYLKEADLDVWYLNGWVALYQFIFGLMCFPITFVPIPGGDYITPRELPQYFLNGLKCFVGIDSIVTGPTPDQCSYFWLVFIVFIAFNMTYNILILVVFQRGSSTLAVIASAARLALSNFGFLIKPLAGEAYQDKLTLFDVLALIILILGIVIYSVKKESSATEKDRLKRFLNFVTRPFELAWQKVFFCFYTNNKKEDEDLLLGGDAAYKDSVNTKYYPATYQEY